MRKFSYTSAGLLATALTVHAQTISISGDDFDFADYSALPNQAIFGPSTIVSGDYTLSLQNDANLEWSTSWSTGSYVTRAEVNFRAGSVDANAASAFSNDSFLAISLSTAGSEFDWTGISMDIWRNGAAAATHYQFAYSSDSSWDETDLLGSATVISSTGNTNIESIVFDTDTIVSSITGDVIRLYYWGASSAGANTHITNVSANYTAIPETGTYALIVSLLISCCAIKRRQERI